MNSIAISVARNLGIKEHHVSAVLALLDEGATIPFIARYRKDKTGALDELQVQQIKEEAEAIKAFRERKNFIEKTISEQGKMTEALQKKLNAAATANELEDIYLPFKPKRKTKAQAAREHGLEPLALLLLEQEEGNLPAKLPAFFNDEVPDEDSALKGARAILAELFNENAELRARLRLLFEKEAFVSSAVFPEKEKEGGKYKDYFNFSEPAATIPSHRMLAVLRGFMEGVLKLSIMPEEETALALMEKQYLKSENEAGQQVKKAIREAYKKMLQPSLESELRISLKARADEEAIAVFAENLRQLLLSSPLGSKRILAIDPGYRTGCKVVVLDENGELQTTGLIFIHEAGPKTRAAAQYIRELILRYRTGCFAIGDGTAGRETEQFIKKLQTGLPVFLVNEDGASIYSASAIAREEFPDQDITVRGAVSIGRRLMDPLAELVKIDPKSIGVGQYQHDVNQARLKEKLDRTVESCVNAVGVDLNTAGKHLLQYVSGIGPSLAENIIRYRKENGPFINRKALSKVERLGAKAFEQCAGFLRIRSGKDPLDASGVHPETYPLVARMAADLKTPIAALIGNLGLISTIKPERYISDTTGLHTIMDVLKELKKPGLDPRTEAQEFEFAEIYSMDDVREGMIVPGKVTNLTRFGAFVDIGVKQDGLVHVSEITRRYISDPSEALALNEAVMVKVLEIDRERKRISLSVKQARQEQAGKKSAASSPGKLLNRPEKKNSQALNDALADLKKKFS